MDKKIENSNSIYKIAITGKMGSGKSTLAKIIGRQLNGHITSFSTQIRKMLSLTNLPIERNILQKTGDFFRSFDKVVWVDMLLNEVKEVKQSIIIDGIRYPFEAEKLKENGFVIIKIDSKDKLRRKRISERDQIQISDDMWTIWNAHPTETNLYEIEFNHIINNNESIENLETSALSILNVITKYK